MPKTSSGYLPLTDQHGGETGAEANEFLHIYKDVASLPSKPLDSTGIPSGWITSIPASVSNTVWTCLGKKTAGVGNYVWSNIIESSGTQNNNVGNTGSNAPRGPGLFKVDNTATSLPTINDSDFLADAISAIPDSTPTSGDVVSITYTGLTPIQSLHARYDGSNWVAFNFEIAGNLLVDGTVIADTIKTTSIITNTIKGGDKTSTTPNNGQQGFYLDGNGNFVIGDGSDDMFMTGGGMNIPAVRTTSPISIVTPIDGDGGSSLQETQTGADSYVTPWTRTAENVVIWNPGVNRVSYTGADWLIRIETKFGKGFGYYYVPSLTGSLVYSITMEAINRDTDAVIDTQTVSHTQTTSYTYDPYNRTNKLFNVDYLETISIFDTINALNLEASDNVTDFNTQYPQGIRFKMSVTCSSYTVLNADTSNPYNIATVNVSADFANTNVLQTTTEFGTPDDTYINYTTADATKHVMEVEGGRSLRAKPEVVWEDGDAHGTIVTNAGLTTNLNFLASDIKADSTYLIICQNPADDSPPRSNHGASDWKNQQVMVYVDEDHEGYQYMPYYDEGQHMMRIEVRFVTFVSGPNDMVQVQIAQWYDYEKWGVPEVIYPQKILRLF